MKGIFKLNSICSGLALAGIIGFSGNLFAAADFADTMPSIEGKKVLVGYWHNWDQGFSGDYAQGYPLKMALKDTPKEYNVVMASFMKSQNGASIPTFTPYYGSDESFREEISILNERGQAVLLSLGGADAHIELHEANGDIEKLANEIIRLVDVYGFDGLDIDLEQSAIKLADNETVIPAALKKVRKHYEQQGKHFIISMAPEIPYLTKANPQYKKYIERLDGYYDFIAPQYYNQGAFGIGFQPDDPAKEGWWVNYTQDNDSKKYEFIYHFSKELITNKHDLSAVKIPSDKLVIGLPSNASAAGSGFVKTPDDVYRVFADLEKEGQPLRGLMTWSINWDEGDNVNHESYNGQFRKAYAKLIEDKTIEDNQKPAAHVVYPREVTGAADITLDGSRSRDPEGEALSYKWEQISGPQVTLDNLDQVTTCFTLNSTDKDTELKFRLTVNDGELDSEPFEFTIRHKAEKVVVDNQKPTAHVKFPAEVIGTVTVVLNGSDSVDPEGEALSYKWEQISGPQVTLDNKDQVQTRFILNSTNKDTELKFRLTVNDGELDSEPFEFTIKHKAEKGDDVHASWQSDKIYVGGDMVSFNGKQYKAKWWTKGNQPDSHDVWENMSHSDNDEWESDRVYHSGDKTQWQGKTWVAKWWTKGDKPNNSPVWKLVK